MAGMAAAEIAEGICMMLIVVPLECLVSVPISKVHWNLEEKCRCVLRPQV